jgi:hypothetical protein
MKYASEAFHIPAVFAKAPITDSPDFFGPVSIPIGVRFPKLSYLRNLWRFRPSLRCHRKKTKQLREQRRLSRLSEGAIVMRDVVPSP